MLRLHAMGFAFTGGGFYNIEVEPTREEEKGDQFVAVIKFDNQKPLGNTHSIACKPVTRSHEGALLRRENSTYR
jgi:hypothetical protein